MDIQTSLDYDFDDVDEFHFYLLLKSSNRKTFERNFCLDDLEEEEAWERFRFTKSDVKKLRLCLRIPDTIITRNRLNVDGTEALCVLLRRLSYPNRLVDVGREFKRNPIDIGVIYDYVLEHIFQHFGHKLRSLNHEWLDKQVLADAVAAKGAPLTNCIGFIDGTMRPIARPSQHQRSCYSGHKRTHGLKFQSLMFPNGIIANMYGPMEGKRHDSALLAASGLLTELDTIGNFCVYGDQAYPLRRSLISPYRGAILTPEEEEFNKCMGKVRVCVEWGFGEIVKQFAFLDYKKNLKLLLQPVAKYYLVATILSNCRTCLYGSLTSAFFNLSPPTLEEYLLL